jgi:hypothetical protein
MALPSKDIFSTLIFSPISKLPTCLGTGPIRGLVWAADQFSTRKFYDFTDNTLSRYYSNFLRNSNINYDRTELINILLFYEN